MISHEAWAMARESAELILGRCACSRSVLIFVIEERAHISHSPVRMRTECRHPSGRASKNQKQNTITFRREAEASSSPAAAGELMGVARTVSAGFELELAGV